MFADFFRHLEKKPNKCIYISVVPGFGLIITERVERKRALLTGRVVEGDGRIGELRSHVNSNIEETGAVQDGVHRSLGGCEEGPRIGAVAVTALGAS